MGMLRLLVWRGRHGLAWGLVALVTLGGPPAMGQLAIADLLGALNLSNYPSGMRPPAFKSRTATGQTVALADLRGRVVLLTFWATWCAECRPELPLFESLHRDFGLSAKFEVSTWY